jgi:hypothetical protein
MSDLQSMLEMGAAGFGILPYSAIVANNTTGVVVKGGPGIGFSIHADNNSTNAAYLKIYDSSTVPTNANTPVLRYQIPPSASGPLDAELRGGFVFLSGISYRVTTGIADADTASPAASTYLVSLGFK